LDILQNSRKIGPGHVVERDISQEEKWVFRGVIWKMGEGECFLNAVEVRPADTASCPQGENA
jgi:hypothetical protein